jgi:ABC-type nitrate/sulfonate/bicarbonate transport system permease component
LATTAKSDNGVNDRTSDAAPLAPVTRVPRWRDPDIVFPIAAGIVFLTVWEVAGRLTNPILFAPPSRVASAFVDLMSSGELPRAFLTTMNALIVAFLLSVLVGIPVGVAFGRLPRLSKVLEPYIDAVYATPRVVIVPLVILWFGVGYTGRLFIIWLGTVIPIILNTAIGVRNARPDLIEVATSFNIRERDMIRHVILPGAVPYVAAGMKIAAGRALIGVVIAEIFLDLTGVGGIIQTESAFFRTAHMLVGVSVFGIIGVVLLQVMDAVERRFAAWKGHGGL